MAVTQLAIVCSERTCDRCGESIPLHHYAYFRGAECWCLDCDKAGKVMK